MHAQRAFGAFTTAAALVVLAACGGSGSTGTADKSADQVFTEALAAFEAQPVAHMTVAGSDSSGAVMTVDGVLTRDAGRQTATSPTEGVWISVFTGGVGYVNAHGSGFQKVPADQLASSPVSTMTVRGVADCLRTEHGGLTKGAISTVNGRQVIAIVDDGKAAGATPTTMYVSVEGSPLPVRMTATGPSTTGGRSECGSALPAGVTVTSDFDYPSSVVTITPPVSGGGG